MTTEAILVLSMLGATALVFFLSESHRVRRLRRQHLESHSEMSDTDFLAGINVPASASGAACHIRRAVANILKLPAATVYPSDSFSYIATFGLDSMDFVEFEVSIEQELGRCVPSKVWDKFWKRNEQQDIAGLTEFLSSQGCLVAKSTTPA